MYNNKTLQKQMQNTKIQEATRFATNKFDEVEKKNHFLDVFQILHEKLGIEDETILVASGN